MPLWGDQGDSDPEGKFKALEKQLLEALKQEEAKGRARLEYITDRLEAALRTIASLQPADVDELRDKRFMIAEWRTWGGFRKWFQDREADELAKPRKLGQAPPRITKQLLGGHIGGDSRKTITRAMQHYRLDPKRAWPPSIWPEADPRLGLRPGETWPPRSWSPLERLGMLLVSSGATALADGRLLHVSRVLWRVCWCYLGPQSAALAVLAYSAGSTEDGWLDVAVDAAQQLLPSVLALQ